MFYKNIISLGCVCNVASELERVGLRSASYPFDWVISEDFEQVVDLIENKFDDFIEYECLHQYKNNKNYYVNVKRKIHFYHDFENYLPLYNQTAEVVSRYARRIERFYKSVEQPTLFLRYVKSQEECDYIEDNIGPILSVLRKFNNQNDIVFICNEDVKFLKMKSFIVEKDRNDSVARQPFDKNKELYKFFTSDIFDPSVREINSQFYNQKQMEAIEHEKKYVKNFLGRSKRRVRKIFAKKYIHDKVYESKVNKADKLKVIKS